MEKFVAAMRTDGLGVRLMAMMNALAIANYLGCDFRFTWENNKKNNPFHDVEGAESMFEKDFLSRYFLHESKLKQLTGVQLPDFIGSCLSEIYFECPQSLSDRIRVSEAVFNYLKSCDYRKIFSTFGFSPKNRDAIEAADNVQLSDNQVAIHLRAGDVVYGGFRRSGYYINKIISVPVAIDILKNNKNILVFAQDEVLGEFIKSDYGVTLASDLCPIDFDGVQRALFDIVLMGKCQKIIGGRSGFSMCAAMLSGIRVTEPNKIYSESDVCSLIAASIKSRELNGRVPQLQIAHAIQTFLTLRSELESKDERLELIEMASQYDPDNMLYALLKICHYCESESFHEVDMFFGSLMEKDMDALMDVIKLNFGNSALRRYTDAQEFEANLVGAANRGLVVARILCAVIYYYKKDFSLARKYSLDLGGLGVLRGNKLQQALRDIEFSGSK